MMRIIRSCFSVILFATFAAALGGCGDDSSDSAAKPAASNGASGTPVNASRLEISGIPAEFILVGKVYQFNPTVSAAANAKPTFTVVNQPRWTVFDPVSGRLSGTPVVADVGVYENISIKAIDGVSSTTLAPFSIRVQPASGTALSIAGTPAVKAVTGVAYSFHPVTTNSAGAALSFTISNKPAWAQFNTSSGVLSGTPGASDVGTYAQIAITASAGDETASLPLFALTVAAEGSGVATVTWLPPTTTAQSSAGEVAGYHLYYGTSPSDMTQVADIHDGSSISYVVNGLGSGLWFFAMASYDADQVESVRSSTVSVAL
jgi:hypothetical protein